MGVGLVFDRDRPAPAAGQRWRSVEYLRAVAALAVACVHFEPHMDVILGREPTNSLATGWLGFGGVDLFFVISGFVVWPATWKQEVPRAGDNFSFLLKRLLRVYIPYWAILVALCVIGHVGPSADLAKSFLLFPQPIGRQVLPVAWTLVLEVVFYAFTYLLLFLPGRLRFKALCGIAGIALLGNLLPVVIGVVDSTQMNQVWSWVPSAGWFGPVVAKYVLSLHLLEFVAGAGIAELARSGVLDRLARHLPVLWTATLAWFCGAAFAAVMLGGDAASIVQQYVLQRFVISMGAVGLLLVSAVCTEIALSSSRRVGRIEMLLAWLGTGSYMMYLLHNVALELATVYGLRAWFAAFGVQGAAMFGLWFVAIILLAAWIGNRIELPFYHRLVALLPARQARVRAGDTTLQR